MVVSKIVVLVAHEGSFDTERLESVIEAAVGQELDRENCMFEVRDGGTHEVTLGSIVYSLEEHAPLERAMSSEERKLKPVATS